MRRVLLVTNFLVETCSHSEGELSTSIVVFPTCQFFLYETRNPHWKKQLVFKSLITRFGFYVSFFLMSNFFWEISGECWSPTATLRTARPVAEVRPRSLYFWSVFFGGVLGHQPVGETTHLFVFIRIKALGGEDCKAVFRVV